jgi:hypothetical protein
MGELTGSRPRRRPRATRARPHTCCRPSTSTRSLIKSLTNAAGAVLGPTVILDGQAVGTWKRTLKRESVLIETSLWKSLKRDERSALDAAAQRYGEFVGLPAVVA